MYRNKKTGIIGVIITIIVLVVIVIISNIKIEDFSHIGGALSSFVMPVQNGITYIKNKFSGNNTFFSDLATIKEENKTLKERNSELEKSLRELEVIKSENETLKEYMNLKEKYSDYESIPGYVINKEISNFGNTLIINVGQKDGIEPNMTVISDKGLVGYIISTTNNTSKVQTIIDTATAVSATISTSRDSIIVRGTLDENYNLKATYIPTDAKLLQGDTVETSGIGGIYPKGIKIGKIKEIVNTKNITDRYAIIETAVDFSKLETVLVIK